MKEWKSRYDEDLRAVFTEAAGWIDTYPDPLKERARLYLDKFNPLLKNSTKNYICYLLPFWMQPMTGVDTAACRKLSLANIFGMLYFFIQDDIMDAEAPGEWKEQLALGNMYHSTFLRLYRELFNSASPFWKYFDTYIAEWAVSVASESAMNDLEADPWRLAKKSGPVKLASTGSFLLNGRTGLIEAGEVYVDHVLLTLQMVDDWIDREADLASGSENSLLSYICSAAGLKNRDALTPGLVQEYLYTKEILHGFALKARRRHEQLSALSHDSPDLYRFHESLTEDLEQAAQTAVMRRKLLRGGFSNWLSENIIF
ncbi:hypothetical protein [Paenibacillus spongiae]|uniref:Terpene synthase n=1 Tax=Paenibacillus spongiae TaxID=2909671 RepID=A0ABY5SFT3_9BACL|nr:hypothetical protein [Paenibacillus spongiae]UVI31123.1 hypothetical protein L1F29_04560 [Paenibacillus spongiae]